MEAKGRRRLRDRSSLVLVGQLRQAEELRNTAAPMAATEDGAIGKSEFQNLGGATQPGELTFGLLP